MFDFTCKSCGNQMIVLRWERNSLGKVPWCFCPACNDKMFGLRLSVKIKEDTDGFVVYVGDKWMDFDNNFTVKGLVEVFKELGFEAEHETVENRLIGD